MWIRARLGTTKFTNRQEVIEQRRELQLEARHVNLAGNFLINGSEQEAGTSIYKLGASRTSILKLKSSGSAYSALVMGLIIIY